MDIIAFVAGLLFLAAASVQDFLTREVADIVSYGLLLFAIAYGVSVAVLAGSWTPFLRMLFGLAAMSAIGAGLFYAGHWGGADAKLLAGLGALFGLGYGSYDLLLFLAVTLLLGAVYGLLYAIALAVVHRKRFVAEFRRRIREPRIHRLRIAVIAACFLLLTALIFVPAAARLTLAFLIVLIYGIFYLWLFIRVVETSILTKEYPVGKLTEGDWIVKDVVVKGKRVCGPKDLGINDEQIATLKRLKVKSVTVKEGIPFVPSFLFGFIAVCVLEPVLGRLVVGLL